MGGWELWDLLASPRAHLSLPPHPTSPRQVRMVTPRPLLIVCLREPVAQNSSWWALERAGMEWGTQMGLGREWLGPPARLAGYPPASFAAAIALSRSKSVEALWDRAEGMLWEDGNSVPGDFTPPPAGNSPAGRSPAGTGPAANSLDENSPAGYGPPGHGHAGTGTAEGSPASNHPGMAGDYCLGALPICGSVAGLATRPGEDEALIDGDVVAGGGAAGRGGWLAGGADRLGSCLLRLLSHVLAPGPALLLPDWVVPFPNGQLSAFDRMGRSVDNLERWAKHFGELTKRSAPLAHLPTPSSLGPPF